MSGSIVFYFILNYCVLSFPTWWRRSVGPATTAPEFVHLAGEDKAQRHKEKKDETFSL